MWEHGSQFRPAGIGLRYISNLTFVDDLILSGEASVDESTIIMNFVD